MDTPLYMKQVALTTLLIVVFSGLLGYSKPAFPVISSLSDVLCESIESNNKARFKKIIQVYRIKIRHFYEDSICRGESLIRFAVNHEADDVGLHIVKNLAVRTLEQKERDGITLLEWAEKNQKLSSVIIKSVKSRIKQKKERQEKKRSRQ